MKWLVVVLALANIVFLLFTEMRADRATESLLAHQNLHSEKIRVLGVSDSSVPPLSSRTAPLRVAKCLEWGPVDSDKIMLIRKSTGALALKGSLREKGQSGARWWVYLPPLGSEAQANERVAALKGSGITDVLVIRNDPVLDNGISLGVFNDEAAAKTQVAELARKGVNDARIIARAKPDAPTSLIFNLQTEEAQQEFNRLKQAYPSVAARDIACPA